MLDRMIGDMDPDCTRAWIAELLEDLRGTLLDGRLIIGGLRVMVFGELGRILRDPESVETGLSGIRTLAPAAFCAVKLLTLRVEKGAKDKLQALLVVAERKDNARFLAGLSRLLRAFGSDRVLDVVGDAQAAFLALQRDPAFRDHGAEGYSRFVQQAEAGQKALVELLGEGLP